MKISHPGGGHPGLRKKKTKPPSGKSGGRNELVLSEEERGGERNDQEEVRKVTQMARGPVACSRESLGMEPAIMTRVHSPGPLTKWKDQLGCRCHRRGPGRWRLARREAGKGSRVSLRQGSLDRRWVRCTGYERRGRTLSLPWSDFAAGMREAPGLSGDTVPCTDGA